MRNKSNESETRDAPSCGEGATPRAAQQKMQQNVGESVRRRETATGVEKGKESPKQAGGIRVQGFERIAASDATREDKKNNSKKIMPGRNARTLRSGARVREYKTDTSYYAMCKRPGGGGGGVVCHLPLLLLLPVRATRVDIDCVLQRCSAFSGARPEVVRAFGALAFRLLKPNYKTQRQRGQRQQTQKHTYTLREVSFSFLRVGAYANVRPMSMCTNPC